MKKEIDIIQDEFADVFTAERPRLLRYACYRLGNEEDAKDVLQEAFNMKDKRIYGMFGHKIKDLRSYLFKTLSNVCAKWQSSSSRLTTIPMDMKADIADAAAETKKEEDYRRIVQLLTEIPEEQAEVIRLRIYGDNSFCEVAEILSLPLPTVKSRFLYGLEKIRKGMKQKQ